MELRRAIVRAMREGGFHARLETAGPALERVRRYIDRLEGVLPEAPRSPRQRPDYPLFEGLQHRPWYAPEALPAARALQAAFADIEAEYLALGEHDMLHYSPPSMASLWEVQLFHYMGVPLAAAHRRCPRTAAVLATLPGVCLDYPWGDALFSVHAADAHLRAHCSVDNLRLRLHLGIRVPEGCEIRVDDETRRWQPGRILAFEDSFEHEVWNRGTGRRGILIVDLWHPGLQPIEIEALTAGFRKAEVRRLFMHQRLQMLASDARPLVEELEAMISRQEHEPLLQAWWGPRLHTVGP